MCRVAQQEVATVLQVVYDLIRDGGDESKHEVRISAAKAAANLVENLRKVIRSLCNPLMKRKGTLPICPTSCASSSTNSYSGRWPPRAKKFEQMRAYLRETRTPRQHSCELHVGQSVLVAPAHVLNAMKDIPSFTIRSTMSSFKPSEFRRSRCSSSRLGAQKRIRAIRRGFAGSRKLFPTRLKRVPRVGWI